MNLYPQMRLAFFATFLISSAPTAFGAAYYIDNVAGSDTSSGLSAQKTGSGSGPWRSLSRLASAVLQPGDTVYLACGQRWSETLRITSNGTATQRIRVDSWPSGCTDKPVIDGSATIPDTEWGTVSGGGWSTAWPPSLLGNGRFDASTLAPWTGWSDSNEVNLAVASDCPAGSVRCAMLSGKTSRRVALAISNRFPLEASRSVTVRLTARLPAGHTAKLLVRRHADPWDDVGLSQTLTGTGNWQSYEFAFTPKESLSNARLDLSITPGNGPLHFDDVSVKPVYGPAIAVHLDDVRQNPAHHPNHGHLSTEPASPYLRLAKDSASFLSGNASVSNTAQLDTGALPAGASITTGLGLSVRSRAWVLEEHSIQSYSGGIATLQSNTINNLLKGWGYFLTGAAWMLDAPSEWFNDSTAGTLALRAHDDQPPAARARVTYLTSGIDLQGTSYVTVSNLAVQNVGHGILIGRTTGASIEGVTVSRTQGHGVDMVASNQALITQSQFVDTRLDAIAGSRIGQTSAQYAQITRNTVTGSGIPADPAAPWPMPAPARAAIHAGQYALVEQNVLDRVAYVGIRADKGSTIARNHITQSCTTFDDGGGIYIKDTANDGLVTQNTIRDVIGNTNGKPIGEPTQAVGIYLDDWTSGVQVTANTVTNADHGMHIHNAFSNTISGNTLYGNRVNQLWFQENTNRLDPAGDIHSNVVNGNTLVPPGTQAAVYHVSEYAHPQRFASYSANLYSTLLSPLVAVETWQDSTLGWLTSTYTLTQWKAATHDGKTRSLDAGAIEVSPKAFAQYEITGGNLITTSTIVDNADGWHGWNRTAPATAFSAETCPAGWCLGFTAGGSDSLLISPRFSIVKDQWYRLSFDMKAVSGQTIEFLVRRGGGGDNGFESLMGARRSVTGNGAWTRNAFVFKADNTILIDDPVTGDTGARLDFGWLPGGKKISVGNVQLVPISAVDEVTRLALLSNPADTEQFMDCPNIDTEPALCDRYVSFVEQTPVTWPRPVPAFSSEVIFTRSLELIDSDSDGIADSQDACASTTAGVAVDSTGCSL